MGLFLPLLILSFASLEGQSKNLTVKEELITLEEFGKVVQKEAGILIEVPRPYRDRKLDVFVENLPVEKVLKGVGDALRGSWVKTANGFRFKIDTQQRNLEERLRNYDRAVSEASAEGFFLAADAFREIGPENLTEQSATAWFDKRSRGLRESDPAYLKLDAAIGHLLSSLSNRTPTFSSFIFAGSMARDERRRFLDGEVFYCSGNSSNLQVRPNLEPFLPNQLSGAALLAFLTSGPGMNSAAFATFTTPQNDRLARLLFDRRQSLFGGTVHSSEHPLLPDTPYGKALAAWENENELETTLKMPLKWGPTLPKSEYKNGSFRCGDILKFLHLYAGVNCIAEGSRNLINGEPLKGNPSVAHELLRRSFTPMYDHLRVEKLESGQVLLNVRYASHWRIVQEPNEAELRKLEAKAARKELSKEDWAEYAAKNSLRDFASLGQYAVKLPAPPGPAQWFALRLYGSLSPAQREQGVVPFLKLTPVQQFNAFQVLYRSLALRSPADDGLHKRLTDPEGDVRRSEGLNLYLVKTPAGVAGSPGVIDELRIGTSVQNSVGVRL